MNFDSSAAYPYVFATHVSFAVISFCYFAIRGYWMLTDNEILTAKINTIAPHVVDTILLASAITLTIIIQQYPLFQDWLTVKAIALVVYILLGTVALKRGKTRLQRTTAFIAALGTFAFIASVAYYHHPMGLLYAAELPY